MKSLKSAATVLLSLASLGANASIENGDFKMMIDYSSIIFNGTNLSVGSVFSGSYSFDTNTKCPFDGNVGHICGGGLGSPITATLSDLTLTIDNTATQWWTLSLGQAFTQRVLFAPDGKTFQGLILDLVTPRDQLFAFGNTWQYIAIGYTNNLYIGGHFITTAVPEPESYSMLLIGLGLLGVVPLIKERRIEQPNQSRMS